MMFGEKYHSMNDILIQFIHVVKRGCYFLFLYNEVQYNLSIVPIHIQTHHDNFFACWSWQWLPVMGCDCQSWVNRLLAKSLQAYTHPTHPSHPTTPSHTKWPPYEPHINTPINPSTHTNTNACSPPCKQNGYVENKFFGVFFPFFFFKNSLSPHWTPIHSGHVLYLNRHYKSGLIELDGFQTLDFIGLCVCVCVCVCKCYQLWR